MIKSAKVKLIMLSGIGFTAFAIWSGMTYFGVAPVGDYLRLLESTVTVIVAIALRDLPSTPLTPPPSQPDKE